MSLQEPDAKEGKAKSRVRLVECGALVSESRPSQRAGSHLQWASTPTGRAVFMEFQRLFMAFHAFFARFSMDFMAFSWRFRGILSSFRGGSPSSMPFASFCGQAVDARLLDDGHCSQSAAR